MELAGGYNNLLAISSTLNWITARQRGPLSTTLGTVQKLGATPPDYPETCHTQEERKSQLYRREIPKSRMVKKRIYSTFPNTGIIISGRRFEIQNPCMYETVLKRSPFVICDDRKGNVVGKEPLK